MSGKKQHYIPQILLRGFSLSPDGKSPPIVVYSRERGIYRTNTKDAAAECEFYSPVQHEGGSLDDEITTYENELTSQLSSIKGTSEALVESRLAALVIVHLCLRNDHTRKMLGGAGERLVNAVRELFRKTEIARAMMGFDKPHHESSVKQEVRKNVKASAPHLSQYQRTILERKLLQELERRFDDFYESKKADIERLGRTLLNSVESMIGESHKKALFGAILPPELRVSVLAGLHWRLIAGTFVLPDCVAITIQSEVAAPYMLTDEKDMGTVFMPIAREVGLLGTRVDAPPPYAFHLNQMLASCSSDFFIAPSINEALAPLVELIGTRTSQRVDDLVQKTIADSKYGEH